MRRVPITALTTCGVLVGTACGLSLSGSASNDATPTADSGPEVNAAETNATDAVNDDGAGDVAEAAVDAFACPNALAPPELVNVGEFCIDTTEVSITLFMEFVNADAGAPPVQGCEWKTVYSDAGSLSDRPAFVDWCDAWGYCHWAGKRLCGAIDGGKLGTGPAADDPTKSQWTYACTGGDPNHAYPYGDTFDPSVCAPATPNTPDLVYTQTCQGAFPGVFHMSGNAAEWIDSCDSQARDANCLVRGGSYLSTNKDQLACHGGPGAKRDQIPRATGFRCCAP
jgi:formylglycine-generating enzyme required for sulfatase activity